MSVHSVSAKKTGIRFPKQGKIKMKSYESARFRLTQKSGTPLDISESCENAAGP